MGKTWQKIFAILVVFLLTYLAFFFVIKKIPEISFKPRSLWQEKAFIEDKLKKGEANSSELIRLAEIYEYLGQKNEARRALQQALVLALGEQKNEDLIYHLEREIARLYAEEGNFALAEKILSRLKKEYPHKAGAYNSQGHVYLKKKKTLFAKKEFEQGKKVDRRDPESYQNLAMLFEKKRDYKNAQKILEEAIKENPEHPKGYLALADYYARRKNQAKALTYYQKAYEKNRGNSVKIMEKYAEALEKMGKKEEAEKIWDEILVKDPKNAKALAFKAKSPKIDPEKSLALYKEALSWDPQNQELAQKVSELEKKETLSKNAEKEVPNLEYEKSFSEKTPTHGQNNTEIQDKPKEAEAFYQEGIEKFHQGNYTEALAKFRDALKQNPSHFNYLFWEAKTLEKLGKKEEAALSYQKALEKPGQAKELYHVGRFFYQEKNYPLAEKAFHRAAEEDPKYAKAIYAEALSQEKQGKSNQAQDNYRKALAIDPSFKEARYNLALLLQEKGQNLKALEELQVLENQGGEADVYFQKGQILQKLKEPKEAIRAYEKAISLKEDFYEARFNLALLYSSQGEKEKALSILKPLLDKNPTAELFYTLGKIEEERGQKNTALSFYDKAIKIDPKFSQAYINASLLFTEMGDFSRAENYLQKALENKENQFSIRQNLAKVLLLQKKYPEAETHYLWLLQNEKSEIEVLLGYGRLLEETKRFPEAVKTYRKALAKKQNDLRILEKLAYLYYEQLKDKEEAKKLFQKILELKPDHPQKKEIRTILATL